MKNLFIAHQRERRELKLGWGRLEGRFCRAFIRETTSMAGKGQQRGQRDRCYLISDGKETSDLGMICIPNNCPMAAAFVRVHAPKRPSKRTQAALLNLFKAARAYALTLPPKAD